MDDQLTAISGTTFASYTYFPNGLRKTKTVDGVTTTYIWDGDQLIAEIGTSDRRYVRGLSIIASIGSEFCYYLHDAHGNVVALTNSSGSVTRTYEYDAFGNQLNIDPADTNPFRYCGEYWDTETERYYLRARYYDSSIGRFTQEDPHWNTGNMVYGDDPVAMSRGLLDLDAEYHLPSIMAVQQSGNLYVYCLNDPVAYIDSTGELAWPGEIHNKVVQYVGEKHGFYQEQRIGYKTGRTWGRADLISPTGEIWDVKPDKTHHIVAGEAQVLRYVDGIWIKWPESLSNTKLHVGASIAPDAFVYSSRETTYYVTYYYAGGGVIAYNYEAVTDWKQVEEAAMEIMIMAGASYLFSIAGSVVAPILAPI